MPALRSAALSLPCCARSRSSPARALQAFRKSLSVSGLTPCHRSFSSDFMEPPFHLTAPGAVALFKKFPFSQAPRVPGRAVGWSSVVHVSRGGAGEFGSASFRGDGQLCRCRCHRAPGPGRQDVPALTSASRLPAGLRRPRTYLTNRSRSVPASDQRLPAARPFPAPVLPRECGGSFRPNFQSNPPTSQPAGRPANRPTEQRRAQSVCLSVLHVSPASFWLLIRSTGSLLK